MRTSGGASWKTHRPVLKIPKPLLFFCVSIVGVGVDITTGALVLLNESSTVFWATAAGLIAGMIVTYFLHEIITFNQGEVALSFSRFFKYCTSSVLVLGVRFVCLTVFTHFIPDDYFWNLVSLIGASGVSFVTNYFVSNLLVFKRNE